MILGGDALDRLRRSHVAVFGLGGQLCGGGPVPGRRG